MRVYYFIRNYKRSFVLLTILIHVVTSIFADDRDKATEDNHVSNAAAVDSSTIAALTRRGVNLK